MKTLVNVRAACRLAYGVEIETAQVALKILHRLEMSAAFAKPFGKARPGQGRVYLDESFGGHRNSIVTGSIRREFAKSAVADGQRKDSQGFVESGSVRTTRPAAVSSIRIVWLILKCLRLDFPDDSESVLGMGTKAQNAPAHKSKFERCEHKIENRRRGRIQV